VSSLTRTSWKANAPPGRTKRPALRNSVTGSDWWIKCIDRLQVEEFAGGERFDRGFQNANLPQPGLSRPCFGHLENLLIAIDTDNGTLWVYEFGGEDGDIAGATAQVQDPHARVDSGVAKKTLGDRS
jgi:hypothetical protein